MNWLEGYTSQFYMTIVDPNTWRDVDTISVPAGTVTKTADGLMESADITMTQNLGGERIVRVYVVARQSDDGERAPIFTGLMQTPNTEWDGTRRELKGVCYSVLKPASDILLPRGWYAAKNAVAAEVAADLLDVLAPVEVEGESPKLIEYIVAESNETRLTMARKILDAIGWRIRINGNGNIKICPAAEETSERFDSLGNDIVELKVTDEQDLYSCPNVFRAVSGDTYAEARDEERIEARGREVWAQEENVTPNDGESLREYAQRRLREMQSVERKVKYSRRFLPDIVPGDMVELHLPAQDVAGIFRIERQQITLGYNATVDEDTVFVQRDAEREEYTVPQSAYLGIVGTGQVGYAQVGVTT